MSTNDLHVVFGTGPAGTTLAEELVARGKRVRSINRSGKARMPAGVEVLSGNMLDAANVRELSAGASAVYHCANVHYAQQAELMPRFQETIIAGAAHAGARLVVLDTLYVYGSSRGLPMTEATPHRPNSRKGRMRADLVERYLAAHQAGTVEVALGRAADFFGPKVLNSVLGDRVFPALLAGRPAQLIGNVDLPHSYSYIGDVARGLAILGERPEAVGRSWLLPVAPPATQRAMVELIGQQLGRPVRVQALPKIAIQLFGLFDSFMREFVEMFYQYTEPQVVDSRAFEQTFGVSATPLPEGIRETLRWYAAQAGAATPAAGAV